MPIVGLTDNAARLPLLGTFRKGGEKRPGSNRPGPNLDYLRLELEPQYKAHTLVLAEIIGARPVTISGVRFLFGDTVEEVVSSYYELWGGSRTLYRRCDGQTVVRSYEQGAGYSDKPKPCQCDPDKRECRVAVRMRFVLEPVLRAGILGHFVLVSSSLNDAKNLSETIGGLLMLPVPITAYEFEIGRHTVQISYPNPKTGKRGLRDESLLYIKPANVEETGRLLAAATEHIRVNAAALADGLDTVPDHSPASDDTPSLPAGDPAQDAESETVEGEIIEGQEVESLYVHIQKVQIVDKDGKRRLHLFTMTDDGESGPRVTAWTRQLFRDNGWISDDEWSEPGVIDLNTPIPATIEREDNGYWQLIDVIDPFAAF